KPLKEETVRVVGDFYKVLRGRIPIIASGGVFTGDDAFEMIQNGANLVQIHSAIVYKGPSIGRKINKRLADILRKRKYKSVSEAVGSRFLR
ncbi:MAG: dihydroorotate dehydrogenase (quinone), partial [Alphaproteobacteria bacterium]|nr:dihydroorotate dehydrogenase (quinone) [Alphaproteobacteria bacterium]